MFAEKKIARGNYILRELFCESRKNPQKSQKLEPPKYLVPHGMNSFLY